jgi:DNA-binding response OmpR family regulator
VIKYIREEAEMAHILVVEDEISINELIQTNLELVGHTCIGVYDGITALKVAKQQEFNLMILDVMLPEMDGFQVFDRNKHIPTIFLTARSSLADKVKGLIMGADDYLAKPFEMLELLARVAVVLRRSKSEEKYFTIADTRVELESRKVYVKEQLIECTPREYQVLEVLIRNRNIALSREKLLELAWGYEYEGDTRTVDVHIQKLRKKLGLENHIKTVFKLGYRLEA